MHVFRHAGIATIVLIACTLVPHTGKADECSHAIESVPLATFKTADYSGRLAIQLRKGYRNVFVLTPGGCHYRSFTRRPKQIHFLLNNVSTEGRTGRLYAGVQIIRLYDEEKADRINLYRNENKKRGKPIWKEPRDRTYDGSFPGLSVEEFFNSHRANGAPDESSFENRYNDREGTNEWHSRLAETDISTWAYHDEWVSVGEEIKRSQLPQVDFGPGNFIMKSFLFGSHFNEDRGNGIPFRTRFEKARRMIVKTFSPADRDFSNVYEIRFR